jgi:hypothetical protein
MVMSRGRVTGQGDDDKRFQSEAIYESRATKATKAAVLIQPVLTILCGLHNQKWTDLRSNVNLDFTVSDF